MKEAIKNTVQTIQNAVNKSISGFGGLGVSALASGTKFAGSNPDEAVGFFRAKKSSACLPSEGK
jgi:hypothetical protein